MNASTQQIEDDTTLQYNKQGKTNKIASIVCTYSRCYQSTSALKFNNFYTVGSNAINKVHAFFLIKNFPTIQSTLLDTLQFLG